MIPLLLACAAMLLSCYYFFTKSRTKCRLPLGPKGVPIFGNALQMDMKNFSNDIIKLGKDYDHAYTVKLFGQNAVIFKSYEMIKEALTSSKYAQMFSGRPRSFLAENLTRNDVGLSTYSKQWAALRKKVFRGLKTYGTHMKQVEALVQEELTHLIDRIQDVADVPVDSHEYIRGYIISIVVMLNTGRYVEYDDPLMELLNHIIDNVDSLLSPGVSALMTSFPWLQYIPLGCGKVYQKLVHDISVMKRIFHEDLKKKTDKNTCFLEFLLEEENKSNMTDENVNSILINIVSGATGTSTASMYSLLLVLAANSEVQTRVQEEIDREIGTSRLPCVEDKNKMPYSQAVLWELLRLYPVLPLAIPHCNLEDVEFRDYFFPKDSVVFYSVFDVHHDETFWKNPWQFNPSRFLDSEGNILPPEHENKQRIIAFGLGKRSCIGENLARLRIFLALIAILQKFTILPDPDKPLPSTDPRTFRAQLFLKPQKYNVVFHPRDFAQ